jgi:hypothetical protein
MCLLLEFHILYKNVARLCAIHIDTDLFGASHAFSVVIIEETKGEEKREKYFAHLPRILFGCHYFDIY